MKAGGGDIPISSPFKHLCPWCGNDALFQPHGHYQLQTVIKGGSAQQRVYVAAGLHRCTSCERPLLVTFDSADNVYVMMEEKCRFLPPIVQEADPDIPEKIRKDFQEALDCFGARAWNGVGAMARRAIQRAVLEQGGVGKDLHNQIEDLKNKGKLVGTLLDFAHQIRIIGRDGAHAEDKFADLDQVDAEDAITFCRECFDHLFVTPKRLERQRDRRPK